LSFLTKSATDSAPTALSLTSSLTACGDLSNTTQSCPFLMSRRTMLAPILPSPIIPSCISSPLQKTFASVCYLGDRSTQGSHCCLHPLACGKDRRSSHKYVRPCLHYQRRSCFINTSVHSQLTAGIHLLDHFRDAANFWQC